MVRKQRSRSSRFTRRSDADRGSSVRRFFDSSQVEQDIAIGHDAADVVKYLKSRAGGDRRLFAAEKVRMRHAQREREEDVRRGVVVLPSSSCDNEAEEEKKLKRPGECRSLCFREMRDLFR